MKDKKFNGPLFIVGLSRSGTKLIRDLLNRNERIGMPGIETHFIPGLLANDNLGIMDVYKAIGKSAFAQRLANLEYPSFERLEEMLAIDNKTDLIEAILKYYSLEGKDKWKEDV